MPGLWSRLHHQGKEGWLAGWVEQWTDWDLRLIWFYLQGNLKQHQAIHNNSPKQERGQDEDGDSGDTASTTQDSDNKDESLLNMANENGLKRSSSADLEDSLPPSKRPPGK